MAQDGGRFLVVHRYLGQVLRLIRGATNVQGATIVVTVVINVYAGAGNVKLIY